MRKDEKVDRDAVTTDNAGILKDFLEAARAAGVTVMTDQQREASRRKALSELAVGQSFWLFAYGSLIWNPVIEYAQERLGQLSGWHRDFCIHLPMGRGTLETPGLMMGLKRGGHCMGKVYRFAPEQLELESTVLWKREMNTDIYIPTWLDVHTPEGKIKALALVVDPSHARYRPLSNVSEQARVIAAASGPLGRNVDYLLNTATALKGLGIRDESLEALVHEVLALEQQKGGDNTLA
jgi:cation transport protein ChaC